MTPLPAPLRWLYSLEWRRGFFDWARSDGVTWVYIFKVLLAAFLTLWLAMRLELPPRTAMITVFIVMQPQSGQVFAKSFYRFLGTLAGSAMMVTLIALFAQNTELFLGSLAIWVGICSAGAARCRNFRAYGFVLAGYTAAMVGLPALAHPDGAFMAAVWRVLEISLGILCSTVISAAILPQTASAAMRNALYQRFGVFACSSPMACAGAARPSRSKRATCASSPKPWAWKAAQRHRVRRPAHASAQRSPQSPEQRVHGHHHTLQRPAPVARTPARQRRRARGGRDQTGPAGPGRSARRLQRPRLTSPDAARLATALATYKACRRGCEPAAFSRKPPERRRATGLPHRLRTALSLRR
jgi:uncharacterized membrane protein YccC